MDELSSALTTLPDAYASGQSKLIAAAVLVCVVAAIRTFKLLDSLPKPLIPWATLLISVATGVATGLKQGLPPSTIVVTSLTVGLTAVGGWETFGKQARDSIPWFRAKWVDFRARWRK